jgi:hypothetical protein
MSMIVDELPPENDPTFNKRVKDSVEEVAESVRGTFKTSDSGREAQWKPVIVGTSTDGTGTYTHQSGFVYRQNQLVDCFFDVLWTAHTGTGNAALQLPYKVAKASQLPFVGVVQSSTLAFSGYLVLAAQPDDDIAILMQCTSGGATTAIAIAAAGRLQGSIRYVGQLYT